MTHILLKATNISDGMLSTINAMGVTYPFVTLTVSDGGDIFRLVSFSGPKIIENLLTENYRMKRRHIKMKPIGYTYENSESFNCFKEFFEEKPTLVGSRLVGIRVWSHKYLHALQFVYRIPKENINIPKTEEELCQKHEELNQDQEKQSQEQANLSENDDRYWTTPIYGSTDDTQAVMYEFNLGDNEYLTSVEIDYTAVLMSIRFESNIGRTASFGTRGGTSYKFSSFRSSAIIAFYGTFGIWGPHNINHIHSLGVMTQEIHPEISGDCEVLRLLGNYTYRLKELVPMSENKRFYVFKFQNMDEHSIQRKECLI